MMYLPTCSKAERIAKLVSSGESRRKHAVDLSQSAFQLEKICRDLSIVLNVEDKNEEVIVEGKNEEIIVLVTDEIKRCLKSIPESLLEKPPRILNKFDSVEDFSQQQQILLEKIGESFYQVLIDCFVFCCTMLISFVKCVCT